MQSPDTRPFGPTGHVVSAIGQGTWKTDETAARAAVAALRRGLDLGLTHIDTAEMYGSGASESVIGKALEGRRDEVYLVSKVLPSNASRRGTVAACEKSLVRLKTDRLDCFLLHWPGSHPLEETVDAFEILKRDGKIRAWGVSNFDVEDLEAVQAIAPPGALACNQVLYHLKERAIEHAVLPWCRERGIAVVAYTPFGQTAALYTGQSAQGRTLQAIAARHGATPRQVALRFLLRYPELFVIPKAADESHLQDNAAAARLRLEPEDLARIEAAFPRGPAPHSLPMI